MVLKYLIKPLVTKNQSSYTLGHKVMLESITVPLVRND